MNAQDIVNPVRGCHTVVCTPHWVPSGRPKVTTNAQVQLCRNNGRRIYARTTETVEVALKAPARMVCAHGTIPAVQLLLCAIKSCA